MRQVPAAMTAAWKAQYKGGEEQRPTVRATICVASMKRFEYDTALAEGGDLDVFRDRHRTGIFTSIIFGDAGPMRELRNIKSFTWQRSLDQDVATATMVLLNSDVTPIGNVEATAREEDFDLSGIFTYSRGEDAVSANRWGYDSDTGWKGIIVPDRIIKTYEGYGFDETVMPAKDPNLLQSGTWVIDKVTYTHDGDIRIEMRDVGRLLLDQIVFPPVVPYAEYPLSWEKIHSTNVLARDCTGGSWKFPKGTATSSNSEYIGKGLTDPPYPAYVQTNGAFNGHHPRHALKDEAGTGEDELYWLSTGQEKQSDKVWWEVDLADHTTALAGVRLNVKGGPYRVYVSLKTNDGRWIGKKKIPYDVGVGGVDIGADVPFVKSMWADRNHPFDIILPRAYGNIRKVRLTFTRLWDTKVGNTPWRAGIRWLKLYTAPKKSDLGFHKGEVLKVVGNYNDYTAIVKWACAWGGFFWPPHSTGLDFIYLGASQRQTVTYAHADVTLPKGRVWGDFMKTGTAGVAPLTVDLFDKKPLMDMINYVRDIVGFVFFIDETGGVVWRMPNLWALGNYVSPNQFGQRTGRSRTSQVITIDERETLLAYETTLDSGDIRERIFVANSTGKFGTVIRGYVPYRVGFRRVAGWTDQRFESKSEARVMADLIAAQSMFNYRRAKITIYGNPAIQIDDQVRVFERVTNETKYHYVTGITSTLDTETGEWIYELDTHWLGERPSDAWAVKVDELQGVTKAYLNTIGNDD